MQGSALCVVVFVACLMGWQGGDAGVVNNQQQPLTEVVDQDSNLVELGTRIGNRVQLMDSRGAPSNYNQDYDGCCGSEGPICPFGQFLDPQGCLWNETSQNLYFNCINCPAGWRDDRGGDDPTQVTLVGPTSCLKCDSTQDSPEGSRECFSKTPVPTPTPTETFLVRPVTATRTPTATPTPSSDTRGATSTTEYPTRNCKTPLIEYNSNTITTATVTSSSIRTSVLSALGADTATGYCYAQLPSMRLTTNARLCESGTSSSVAQRFAITFFESTGGVSWTFSIRMSASIGFVVYVDGTQVGTATTASTAQSYVVNSVTAGRHLLEVFAVDASTNLERGVWTFQRATAAAATLSLSNLALACTTNPRISYYSTNMPSFGTTFANRDVIEANYRASVVTSGYCSKTLVNLASHSNHVLCTGGTTSNIGQRFLINFEESGGGATWRFRINMDSGYGYSVYLDGTYQGQTTCDVWSGGTNPFTYIFQNVTLGSHYLAVYGGEGCCDGEAGGWQVERNYQGFVDLTTDNINVLSSQYDVSPLNSTWLVNNITYFSTYMPENQGSVEEDKNYIESRVAGNLHGGSGFCTKYPTGLLSHSNNALCKVNNTVRGARRTIGQKFSFQFVEPLGGSNWYLKLYMDAGWGFTSYLDGKLFLQKSGDVWTKGTNPTYISLLNLMPGVHNFVVYGGEPCCDGEAGKWQFIRNNSTATVAFTALTLANVTAAVSKQCAIYYFSTYLPCNQGGPVNNSWWIENQYRNSRYNNPTGSYCTISKTVADATGILTTHSNNQICPGGSASNIGQRFEIFFYENVGGATWKFNIYLDAGYGFVAYFDGGFVTQKAYDVWGSGTNPTLLELASVGTGYHRLVVYGGEGCCDGKAGDWTFSRNSATLVALSVANLNAAASATL